MRSAPQVKPIGVMIPEQPRGTELLPVPAYWATLEMQMGELMGAVCDSPKFVVGGN